VVLADGELTALLFGDGARALVHLPEDREDSERLGRASGFAIFEWMRFRSVRIIGHEGPPQGGRETLDTPLNKSPLARGLGEAGLIPSGPGFRI